MTYIISGGALNYTNSTLSHFEDVTDRSIWFSKLFIQLNIFFQR